jgi:hypothetical protein
LGDPKKIELPQLENLLRKISDAGHTIEHVDLYGGEVGLLDDNYLHHLDQLLLKFGDPALNIVTNLFKPNMFFLKEHVQLSVSFDFSAREKHETVLNNIIKTPKDISILMLASPELMKIDVNSCISIFNSISNIISVEIKPYSQNQSNQLKTDYSQFESYVKKWINSSVHKRFQFINEDLIKKSIGKDNNAYSDDHLYITPNGKFAVLDFDENDREFFLEFDDLQFYEIWKEKEKKMIANNSHCSQCSYQGHCLTEHYRNVTSLEYSCNGFKNLLDWYQNQNKV